MRLNIDSTVFHGMLIQTITRGYRDQQFEQAFLSGKDKLYVASRLVESCTADRQTCDVLQGVFVCQPINEHIAFIDVTVTSKLISSKLVCRFHMPGGNSEFTSPLPYEKIGNCLYANATMTVTEPKNKRCQWVLLYCPVSINTWFFTVMVNVHYQSTAITMLEKHCPLFPDILNVVKTYVADPRTTIWMYKSVVSTADAVNICRSKVVVQIPRNLFPTVRSCFGQTTHITSVPPTSVDTQSIVWNLQQVWDVCIAGKDDVECDLMLLASDLQYINHIQLRTTESDNVEWDPIWLLTRFVEAVDSASIVHVTLPLPRASHRVPHSTNCALHIQLKPQYLNHIVCLHARLFRCIDSCIIVTPHLLLSGVTPFMKRSPQATPLYRQPITTQHTKVITYRGNNRDTHEYNFQSHGSNRPHTQWWIVPTYKGLPLPADAAHPIRQIELTTPAANLFFVGDADYMHGVLPMAYGCEPSLHYLVYRIIFHHTQSPFPDCQTGSNHFVAQDSSTYSIANFYRMDSVTVKIHWDINIIAEKYPVAEDKSPQLDLRITFEEIDPELKFS
jgi:hypothetical protein